MNREFAEEWLNKNGKILNLILTNLKYDCKIWL